jgi:hypothetical protein
LVSFKRFKYTAVEKNKIKSCIDFEDGILSMTDYIPEKLQKEAPLYDMIAAVVIKYIFIALIYLLIYK